MGWGLLSEQQARKDLDAPAFCAHVAHSGYVGSEEKRRKSNAQAKAPQADQRMEFAVA